MEIRDPPKVADFFYLFRKKNVFLQKNKIIMDIERIEELLMVKTLTASQRAEIRKAAEDAGIPVHVKQGCRSCYEKLLVALYELQGTTPPVSIDGYIFRKRGDGFRVYGSKIEYTESTLPSLEVGKLPPSVIATHFVKLNTGDDAGEVEQSEYMEDGTDLALD